MITLTIKSTEFSYDVKALALSFFPEEPCEVHIDEAVCDKDGYFVRCLFHEKLWFEEYLEVPYDKNEVKQVLYRRFSEKTGKTLPWGILTGIRPAKIALRMRMDGKTKAEIERDFQEIYYCTSGKARLAAEVACKEHDLICDFEHEKCYCIYIGIPFCPTRCHYCSFAAYPMKQYEGLVDDYLEALEREIRYGATAFRDRRLTSVYIGGGTPTALSDAQLERLLSAVEKYLPMEQIQEFTVEAGRPDSITREKLQTMKRHGVDRISINPQTMKQETLFLMGRQHTVESIGQVFSMAREEGFDNINMDLIAGLPEETIEDFQHTLEQVQLLEPDSITIHTLVIKRASKLREEQMEQMEQGAGLMEEKPVVEQMQEYGQQFAAEHGYFPYYMYRQKNKAGVTKNTNQENVAYAKTGKECLYNIFIMEELETILALGAGASSKYVYPAENRMERVGNVKGIEEYIARVDEMIERKKREEVHGWH